MMSRQTTVPMNCIDKVLLSYEMGKQHMSFHLILSVQGFIDQDRLNRALLAVMRLHPTLRTIVCSRLCRARRKVQENLEQRFPKIVEKDAMSVAPGNNGAQSQYEKHIREWINRPFDPRRDLPVRVLILTTGEAECSVVFTFHHSAIDGLRAIAFIEEVLAIYDCQDSFESALSGKVAAQRKKDELMALARSEGRRVPRFRRAMLYYMLRFLLMTPFRRSSRIFRDGSPKDEPGIDFCTVRLEPAALQMMKSKAKNVGATANDILMAAALRTIDKWNSLHGRASDKISLMVPVNVADQDHQHIAANLVSFISVAAYRRDRADATELLRRVNRESTFALKQERGSAFAYVYFCYVLSRLPLSVMRAFAKLVKFPVYADTMLHSNLGVVSLGADGDRKGYRIVDFSAVPLVVDVMGMFICISTYEGVLNVNLCYGTGFFRREEPHEFLDTYLGEIENYRVVPQGQPGLNGVPAPVSVA